MFGQNFQNFAQYVRTKSGICKNFKICSDGPSGLQNRQFCSDQPIWPQKTLFFYFTECCVLILEKNHSPPSHQPSESHFNQSFCVSCFNNYKCRHLSRDRIFFFLHQSTFFLFPFFVEIVVQKFNENGIF